jgi:chromosome segregation ATPase
MTQPNKPIERQVEEARPSDPFTAHDGARLLASMLSIKGELSDRMTDIENLLKTLQGNAARIEGSLSETRVERLERELREAELEKEEAETRMRNLEEKIKIKSDAVNQSTDTYERIKAVSVSAYADLEKKRQESRAARIEEIKWGAIKAAAGALAVSGALGIVAFIWFLVQLFLNRGGP